jgi:hypothetical protein
MKKPRKHYTPDEKAAMPTLSTAAPAITPGPAPRELADGDVEFTQTMEGHRP